MRLVFVFSILAALAVAVEARPSKTSHVVHEKRGASSPRWVKAHRLHRRGMLPIRIGLAQSNLDRAEEFVNAVAHPESPDYGKHWSPARIAATFASSQESIDSVKQWLQDEGIDLGRVKLSRGQSADQYTPKQGATNLNMSSLADCDQMVTPDCIRALYQIPKGSLATANNTLGIVEYSPQAFLQSDLDMFHPQFEPGLVGKGPEVVLIDNAIVQTQNQSDSFNGESDLDLQISMGLVFPQNVTVFQVGDVNRGASLGNFLDALDASFCSFQGGDDANFDVLYPEALRCGSATATHVISESYGNDEADVTPRYAERQCAEYMKLALRGVSMVFSSGDGGVAGGGATCRDPATGDLTDGSSGAFSPGFPSTCPWVTAVGATQIRNGSSVQEPETACQEVILSGGGFSNLFAMPPYQKAAVASYFAKNPPPFNASQFNNSMAVRGFPDVSANGANIVAAVNGRFANQFGTSASAPLFASVLNLINEKRLQARKGPVGFVNPVLYANPQVMNDITSGSNPGCGTEGFTAVEGWDPVTGLGTPDFPAMEKLFLSLP